MLTILADDLSGALDSAASLIGYMPSRVYPSLDNSMQRSSDGATVWALDNRHMSPDACRRVVIEVLEHVSYHEPLFIKVDSTLRGPVGSTIDAVLHAMPFRGAFLCPAFPKNGRTVVQSHLYIHGVQIEETPLVSDPQNPLATGSIPILIGSETPLPIVPIPLTVLRMNRIREHLMATPAIYVIDAENFADLTEIATFLLDHRDLLPVGSAGLAEALARQGAWGPKTLPPSVPLPRLNQLVVMVGSMHPQSQKQVRAVESRPEWRVLRGRPGSPYPSDLPGTHVILVTPTESLANPSEMLDQMAETVARHLCHASTGVVVVATGGDTALALIRRLDVRCLDPVRELGPGVVLSHARFKDRELWLVTKSGAFGQDDFLPKLDQELRDAAHTNPTLS